MKTIFTITIFILLTVFYVFGQISKSNSNSSIRSSYAAMKNSDEKFAIEAASGGMIEVEMGKTGQSNAKHPLVKKFASMMIRERSKTNDELKSILIAKNISMMALESHLLHLKHLENKKGCEYDKEFMRMMVEDRRKDIELFKRECKYGNDAEFKQFAKNALPVLKARLDSATKVYSVLKKYKENSKLKITKIVVKN